MEPCPECGCTHIGTDCLYAVGVAMFCQECGHRGPRVHIEPDLEDWFTAAEADTKVQWNQQAQAKRLRSLDGGFNTTLPEGGYTNDTRFSG
jgi:hypothetical protein